MKRAITLGVGLAFTGKKNPSVIPYYPQKTEISGHEERYFPRTYPEHVGVSSGRILAMLNALEKEKRANIHNLLVIKDGHVICECSHPGYSTNVWHLSHSMSKSLCGMAVGLAVDDGLLSVDERLADIFPELHYNDKRFADITVKHLLSMSAGVRFSEAGSVSDTRWTQSFFESAMSYAPGTGFSYNSMNTYILARIVVKRCGKSLTELVTERILQPLGITNFFWEVGPEGVEKGGWGVYMSVESWAKLGYMMMSGGSFDGKRILSEEWVRESTTRQAVTPDIIGPYNYGYQLWVSRKTSTFLFNGMLGQNVWICPTNNIIVAVNAGNNELFQNSPAMAIMEKYLAYDLSGDLYDSCFAGDENDLHYREEHFFERRHWVRPLCELRGLAYSLGFKDKTPFPEEWGELLGRYNFAGNNQSILPLFIRGMQNNLRGDIDSFEFTREGDSLWFTVTEGGTSYKLEVGFYDFKTTVLDYHGEKYIVKAIGEAMEDEDREMLYKLEILFPEMPNTRMIKLSLVEDGKLLVRMSEMPNQRIVDVFLAETTLTDPKIAFIYNLLEVRIGKNFVARHVHDMFAPTMIAANPSAENYTAIMDEEREKIKLKEKNNRFIDGIVKKLFHDSDIIDYDAEEGAEKSSFLTFFRDVRDRIMQIFPKKQSAEETIAEVPDGSIKGIESK